MDAIISLHRNNIQTLTSLILKKEASKLSDEEATIKGEMSRATFDNRKREADESISNWTEKLRENERQLKAAEAAAAANIGVGSCNIDWGRLGKRIEDGKCTVFLGPSVNESSRPDGMPTSMNQLIAEDWARECGFPPSHDLCLSRIAQYMLITGEDKFTISERLTKYLREATAPNFDQPDDILPSLARLPISTFITTNYDDYIVQAINRYRPRARTQVVQEHCLWTKACRDNHRSIFESEPTYIPSEVRPLVFHLHGRATVRESLVMTEDDHLRFLMELVESGDFANRASTTDRKRLIIPDPIYKSLSDTSLVFIGFSLNDIGFRLLIDCIVGQVESSARPLTIAVQLPVNDNISPDKLRNVEKMFGKKDIEVCWKSPKMFVQEMTDAWKSQQGYSSNGV